MTCALYNDPILQQDVQKIGVTCFLNSYPKHLHDFCYNICESLCFLKKNSRYTEVRQALALVATYYKNVECCFVLIFNM